MPIQPIAPLQSAARNLSALDSLLSRGGATFDTAIQNAVQIGRDLSNKQSQQERNFLTEQRRGINLTQRRAENVQQDLEDTRTFDEGTRRFDLGFDQSERQFDLRREDLATGRDIQQQQFDIRQGGIEDRFSAGQEFTAEQNKLGREATAGRAQFKLDADASVAESEADQEKRDDANRQANMSLLESSEDPQTHFDRNIAGNPAFPPALQSLISRRLLAGDEFDAASIQKEAQELRTAENTVTSLQTKATGSSGVFNLRRLSASEINRYDKARALISLAEEATRPDQDTDSLTGQKPGFSLDSNIDNALNFR